MTLATLDPRAGAIPAASPRSTPWTRASSDPLPELTEAQWAHIQARLRATGVPAEAEDDRALARAVGLSGLFGLGLTALAVSGLWAFLS